MMLTGISSIPVSWEAPVGERRVSSTGRTMRPTRYLYAIASEKPLRIPDAAFHPGYLEQLLGPGLFRAPTPQATTKALARHFGPAAVDGRWADDMYTMSPADETTPHRVARIYCAGGTVYEVPENIAGRAWCPQRSNGRGRGVGQQTADQSSEVPDSVFTHDGRRVKRGRGSPAQAEPMQSAPVQPAT